MPLVRCPDCSAEISDQAPACPKCGRPRVAQTTASAVKPKAPLWVTVCKVLGAIIMLWGTIRGATSCGEGNFDDAIPGVIAFVIGMLVFVAGRFGE